MDALKNIRLDSYLKRVFKFPLRYIPYVIFIAVMKITILISIATQQRANQILVQQQQQHRFLRVRTSLVDSGPLKQTTTDSPKLSADELDTYLSHLADTAELVSWNATDRNRTRSNAIWLVYNRVPRSGGHTLVRLMEDLGKENRFSHQNHQYRTQWRRLLTEDEQKNLVTWFEYQHMPKSYDRHFLFVNFTKHQRYVKNLQPVYINLLRDPIEREYSVFRGRRSDPMEVSAEMRTRDSIKAGSGNEWYRKSFEDCILLDDPECTANSTEYTFSRAIPYFCGQSQDCLVANSQWALQRAKLNLEYEYSVVGILENMNETLTVLEQYVPKFFRGASDHYYSSGYGRRHENRYLKKKPPLSEDVRQKLRQNLALEYELYEFARQRLHIQLRRIKKAHAKETQTLSTL